MKKLSLKKKQKGFSVMMEAITALTLMVIMLNLSVFIIRAQQIQKYAYDGFTACLAQTARWGGTNSSLLQVNGKNADLAKQMEKTYRGNGLNITVTAGPEKVTKDNNEVWVQFEWTDPSVYGLGGSHHIVKAKSESIIKGGKLVQ